MVIDVDQDVDEAFFAMLKLHVEAGAEDLSRESQGPLLRAIDAMALLVGKALASQQVPVEPVVDLDDHGFVSPSWGVEREGFEPTQPLGHLFYRQVRLSDYGAAPNDFQRDRCCFRELLRLKRLKPPRFPRAASKTSRKLGI